jgi:serine/threonine protein kinase
VKLIDFGLALKHSVLESEGQAGSAASAGRTIAGDSIAGTLDHAAPEQMGRLPGVSLGPHSDVYGFGRTCYFALLGTPDPDDRQKATLPQGWRRFLADCTARPSNRLPNFGVVLKRLVHLKVAERGAARKKAKEKIAQTGGGSAHEQPKPEGIARIQVRCPHCQQRLEVRLTGDVRNLKCQFCSGLFTIPAKKPEKPSSDTMSQRCADTSVPALSPLVSCPHCKRGLSIPQGGSAKARMKCPHCSEVFVLGQSHRGAGCP